MGCPPRKKHFSPPPKPEVILTNFFAEPTVLLVPITSRDIYIPTWSWNHLGFIFNGGLMLRICGFLLFFKYGAHTCELKIKHIPSINTMKYKIYRKNSCLLVCLRRQNNSITLNFTQKEQVPLAQGYISCNYKLGWFFHKNVVMKNEKFEFTKNNDDFNNVSIKLLCSSEMVCKNLLLASWMALVVNSWFKK